MKIKALVIQLEGTAQDVFYTIRRLKQENPNKTIKQLWQELHRN
jgi:hypothetical protein